MPIVREIKYDGYVFRSKIEAQQYKLFKELGLDVHYEPETYGLDFAGHTVNYLVDFFLPDLDSYVEIKLSKCPTHDECVKCFALAQTTGKDVYLFYEPVGKKGTNGYKYAGGTGAFYPLQRWTQCPVCKSFDITTCGIVGGGNVRCGCEARKWSNAEAGDLTRAFESVRSERFGA
tara:strand:+ start:1537 stop:2061 length:525 start_codon:yes stop_codon:yes gene_type:complete